MITEQDILYIRLLFEMIDSRSYDVPRAEAKLRKYASVQSENQIEIFTDENDKGNS